MDRLLHIFLVALIVQCAITADPSLKDFVCHEEFTYGYSYRNYHRISELTTNRTDGFRLDFKVRAGSNAHISFAENAFPSPREVVYEIVLGASRNSYSDIRRGRGQATKVRESTMNVVSSSELRGFWITIHNDGRIVVGKEDDDLPFLMWKDPSPIRINFFSFSTWKDVYGKWYYFCRKNESKAEEDDIYERPLTMTDKLRRDLLSNYDPYIAPQTNDSSDSKRTIVYVHVGTSHVSLNERRSILNVHGTMSMSWRDEKLRWSPDDYGNLTSIVMTLFEIWIPDIILYNSAGHPYETYRETTSQALVSSSGSVLWAPQAHHSAFCKSLDFSQWPKDTQTCELRLGFWSQQHMLQLELMENGTYIDEQSTTTEWEIIDLSAETVWDRTPWEVIDIGMDRPLIEDGSDLVDPVARNEFGELEIVVHSNMAVKFTLTRRNKGYNTVLLVPLAMVLVSTLLSFWASPVGSSKLALQCLSMIITTVFLLTTWRSLPVHADNIPSIISAYRGILVMTCLSMISTVITINLTSYGPAKQISPLLSQFLASQWLSYLCFLPTNDEQVNKRYNALEDTQELNEELNEKDPRKNDNEFQWNWILLSTLIDRVMFFIYSILFLYTFSSYV